MGSYTFRWEHPADEVYVTGTFDDWAKSIKLDKKDTVHEKTVTLKPTTEKILYKFVADGEWKHDHTGKSETDDKGNVNNVLYPEDIKPPNSMAQQTISSVAPGASTTEMAGLQPKEPRGVPEVVSESQQEAHASPEAAANPEAVQEKKQMENELKAKVPEEKAESENTGGIAGAVAGGVAAAGAAAAGGVAIARQKAEESTGKDPVSVLPESVQNSINNMNDKSSTNRDAAGATANAVPSEVTESQKEAHVGPEAAANPEAVKEKSEVEQELLKKVPESQDAGQPAPTEAAATSATAPAGATTSSGAPQLADPVGGGLAPISMDDKNLNASADTPAKTPAEAGKVSDLKAQEDSRDVSPMSKPTTNTQPTVTTGVAESAAPATSKPVGTPRDKNASASTPQKRNSIMDRLKNTPESSKSTGSEGKKKGLFSRIKEKLKNYRRAKGKSKSSCFGKHDEEWTQLASRDGSAHDSILEKRHKEPAIDQSDEESIETAGEVEMIAETPPRLSLDFSDGCSMKWDRPWLVKSSSATAMVYTI